MDDKGQISVPGWCNVLFLGTHYRPLQLLGRSYGTQSSSPLLLS